MSNFHYFHDAGGALEANHHTYIDRQADGDLFNALKNGEFCYVLNARQMGKSSLRTKTMGRLNAIGAACTFIDLSSLNNIGNSNTEDRDQIKWYLSLLSELVDNFEILTLTEEKEWISQNIHKPPNILLMKFFDEVLLQKLKQDKIIIFLDEIDVLVSKKFKYDFLGFIRSCYNRRADYPDFNRIVFCLVGVAAPGDLIIDGQHTFNIGKDIELTGLELNNTIASFSQGLRAKVDRPEQIIKQIFDWTNGQPFLTQKFCQLAADRAENGTIDIDRFMETNFINNWASRSDLVKEHLQYISDYLLTTSKGSNPISLLIILGKIIDGELIKYNPNYLEHAQLKVSGIIKVEPEGMKIFNQLYARIFTKIWIEQQLDRLQKVWFPQQDLEELTYLAPPSKFIQSIAKTIDTNILAIVTFLFSIQSLSLYTSYHLFSSPAWKYVFDRTGNSLYIEAFRSALLIFFTAYSCKYLFYKETQKILTLDRLWWLRTCVGIIGFLLTIFVLVYNLYLGPVNLATKYPLTNDMSWFKNYSIPYLCYLPYAIINFIFISIPIISITTYSSVINISNNIKIIKIFNESIEKINNYVDYVGSECILIEDRETISNQMIDYFLRISNTFLEDFTRYSILFAGIIFVFIFESILGKITLAEIGLTMTLMNYCFSWIALIIIFFFGAIEYQKIFKQSCALLIKIGDVAENLYEFRARNNLMTLIRRGVVKIRNQEYIHIFFFIIAIGSILIFNHRLFYI